MAIFHGRGSFGWKTGRALLASTLVLVVRASDDDQGYSMPVGITLKGHQVPTLQMTWNKRARARIHLKVHYIDGQTFDYIVVGAGAAGCAVAARLALAGADVLLLEAGGDPNILTKIPGAALALLGSNMDWHYQTISNNMSCLSSQDRQCIFARGKCLGGSTSINYMMYTRGNRRDYDEFGVPGWSWKELKPFFLKYEALQVLDQLPNSSVPYHNTTGIMKIEFFSKSENPWHSRLIEGYESLQIPFNPDVNAESQIGVSRVVGYVYNGERMSAARAYLTRGDVKSKLQVAKHTMCNAVIIDQDNVARGVTAVQGGKQLNLYTRKEVVLSAGTIETPQILMSSGVGPAEHLKSMGIPVKADLLVGDDMRDHVLPIMFILVDEGEGIPDDLKEIASKVKDLAELLLRRRGALTSNGLTDVTTFLNTECYDFEQGRLVNTGPHCEVPDLQLIHAYVDRGLLTIGSERFKGATGLDEEVIAQVAAANERHALLVMSPVLLRMESRGNVRLGPAIFPNYLSVASDEAAAARAMRVVRQLVATRSFRSQNASLLRPRLKDCACVPSGQYWSCYARHMTLAVYHATGTCALGRVLDARLRVRGVRALRVADAHRGILTIYAAKIILCSYYFLKDIT